MTANCTATACTVVTRGIDVVDGKTQVTALKQEHRRGAVVKITNFPQLAIISRILQGLESASSTFMFGDGSTTTTLNKYLKVDNGTTNFPFLRYNETLAQWQFSDDGVSTITFVTSSAGGLSASSTKGITITDSKVLVNSSSTGGIVFDSTTGAVYVSVSSTSMALDSLGRLYWDRTLNFTPSGTWNFNGNVTTTGTLTANSPISTRDVANKGYVDSAYATGTAGVAITAGQALFMSTTSSLFQTSSSVATSTFNFVGISENTYALGATVTFTYPGRVNHAQSGLSPGYFYYLNGTTGQLSTTPGTFTARVGLALSATDLLILPPKYVRTGTYVCTGTGNTFGETGFYPAIVRISAGSTAVGAVIPGSSYSDDSGGIRGLNQSTGVAGTVSGNTWSDRNGSGVVSTGSITKSVTGITFACTYTGAGGANTQVYWQAESL
jgi:hypothetical protein